MNPRRLARTALLAALAVVAAAVLAACGREHEEGEPHREGVRVEMAGLDYNVFITRQLNLELPTDRAYYDGPEPRPGRALYGVFIEVCNRDGEGNELTADHFVVKTNQGEEFEPLETEADNEFAYRAVRLPPHECLPAKGSIPQLGPTGGSVLLFDLPLEATENRPLELEVSAPVGDPKQGIREHLEFELDI